MNKLLLLLAIALILIACLCVGFLVFAQEDCFAFRKSLDFVTIDDCKNSISQACCANESFALSQSNVGFTTTAKSAIVMEKSSGRVLFEKDADTCRPMASTTKILTALTVIENCNLEDVVVIPKEACGVEGSSIYLREGEKLTVLHLLQGLMLRSGNDCAVALALHTSGSLKDFATLMNQTASRIGCTNSNFTNPHGLHDNNHYTTARDLALISCEALKNDTFRQIVSAKSVKIPNDGCDYPRVLVNKNKLLSNAEGADGIKTGYTKKAGRCFVGSATRNGMQVVVVVLNCGPMFEESAQMLNTAFANYNLTCIIPKNKLCGVVYQKGKGVYYYCEGGFSYPLAPNESYSRKITVENDIQKVEVSVNGKIVFEKNLTAMP